MQLKRSYAAAAILVLVAFFAVSAFGQGIIIPIPCERRPCVPSPPHLPAVGVLPVRSIKIDTSIKDQVAVTTVEQVFQNNTNMMLEGVYFFPIPESAAIVEFAIWENGKRLSGEVRSKEEARRIYDSIVRKQRDPGLLEYAGRDLFQASIFPISPHSDKKIELKYSQILSADNGTVNYKYPLGTGRNIRFRGLDDGFGPQRFGTVSGSIKIESKGKLRNIFSPTHSLDVKMKGDRSATASFESSSDHRDLQLFYTTSNDDVGMTLLTHREPGKDGFFLLMLSPRDDIRDSDIASKDIVFVLDTSGSMADEGKIEKARAALLFGIRTLRDGDRFNVINFSGEEHLMSADLVKADEAGRSKGVEFVNKLTPSGGTNINDSLAAAMKQFDNSGRPQMLVFMTDGLPTVGETDVAKILANIRSIRQKGVRIFPFGFGYDVNTSLLDGLGTENGGISGYVQPKEDIEIKVSNFFAKVSSPVLSSLSLDLGTLNAADVFPKKLPDLFKGSQITLIGRYKNSSDLRSLAATLSGSAGREQRKYTFNDLSFPLQNSDNEFLPRLWAMRRVGWLIEQIRLNGENKELRDEIVELGTRYGIVTPYTSFLATDGSERLSGARRMSPAKSMSAMRGADAVRMSIQQNEMQAKVSLASDGREGSGSILIEDNSTTKYFGGKTFVNQSGVWVDAEYSAAAKLPEKTIKFGSDEYFAMASSSPRLAGYFSIGDQIVVVFDGKVYRVVP